MKSAHIPRWISVLALMSAVSLDPGCNSPSGDGGNGPPIDPGDSEVFTLSPDNAPAVTGAIAMAETMVAGGSDSASIAEALVTRLSADSRVALAAVDPSSGFVVAHFHDGETQTFQAIGADDLAEGDIDPLDNLPEEDLLIAARASVAMQSKLASLAQPGGFPIDSSAYAIPDLSTALMASTIPYFHPEWVSSNETEQIKGMLESRGYTVTREPLTLKHFRELHRYGVVLIETHGVWLESSTYKDITVCQGFGTTVPNCGGPESLFGVLTTTTTTDEPAETYREDIDKGRLILHNVTRTLVVNNVPVQTVTRQYYAVTSLFLKQHVTEPYPDGMLVMLNACKAFTDGSSSIGSFILSKSESSQFLGWDNKLRYQYAAKAALNLFQFMTASNEELKLKDIWQLRKRTPPVGVAVDLNWALFALSQKGLDTAPTGARLERRAAATESGDTSQSLNLLLMPYAMEWTGPQTYDETVRLGLLATQGATVTIGGDAMSATPEMLCCSASWILSDSPNRYGDIVPWYFSRRGPARTLRRWKPVITVKSTGGGPGMQYEVRFQPQGRASIDGESFRGTAWQAAPPATFDLNWDKGGSSLWWQVTGESDDSEGHTTFQGTGTRVFSDQESGGMSTSDGRTVTISVEGVITYTTTRTWYSDGTTEQSEAEHTIATAFEAPLRANWSVEGGTETDSYNVTSWQEFFADPPFDNTEPR